MTTEFVLNAEARADVGKGASRRLRRLKDLVPGIIYGGDKAPQSISMIHKDLAKSLEVEAFYSHLLTLNVSGASETVILKDLQRHPSKPKILHADFLRVSKDKKITVHVPLHFINEEPCKGVKVQGGVISHLAIDLEITCLPDNLPEYITVDMLEVELNQIVHISDLKLPTGVDSVALLHGAEHDRAVVSVHAPKVSGADEPKPAATTTPPA